MNEKQLVASEALKYATEAFDAKIGQMRRINKKIQTLLICSALIFGISLIFGIAMFFTMGGAKPLSVLSMLAVLIVLTSIAVLSIALFEKISTAYSNKVSQNLLANSDLIIFYNERIATTEAQIKMIDKQINAKKALLMVSIICMLSYATTIAICCLLILFR